MNRHSRSDSLKLPSGISKKISEKLLALLKSENNTIDFWWEDEKGLDASIFVANRKSWLGIHVEKCYPEPRLHIYTESGIKSFLLEDENVSEIIRKIDALVQAKEEESLKFVLEMFDL